VERRTVRLDWGGRTEPLFATAKAYVFPPWLASLSCVHGFTSMAVSAANNNQNVIVLYILGKKK
jgi:hypothetical protein